MSGDIIPEFIDAILSYVGVVIQSISRQVVASEKNVIGRGASKNEKFKTFSV